MKHGKKTPKQIKKELDILWSKAIRNRDKICRKCKKAPASQAAHIFGRNHLTTRWDLHNGWGACYYCHILWSHREAVEFAEWIKKDVSPKVFNELRRRANTIYDSSNLRADYERIKRDLTTK